MRKNVKPSPSMIARQTSIVAKRVYQPSAEDDGVRILVDRLWPRGLSKEDAQVDAWLKEIAPTTELRTWFDHRPERWPHFMRRYRLELQADPEHSAAFCELLNLVQRGGKITLLYGAKDHQYNNAVALKKFLDEKIPVSHSQPCVSGGGRAIDRKN